MADPLDVLRLPVTPLDPDPAFATALRARLRRALDLPPETTMTSSVTAAAPTPAGAAIPYLAVRGARAAIDWYVDVLGAALVGEPVIMPDGRVGHAELALGDGVLYLADESPGVGAIAPDAAGASVSLLLQVDDVDARAARAAAAGATVERGPQDTYGARNAWLRDPFGHRWNVRSALREPAVDAIRPGDVAGVTLRVPDVDRAASFYADVLGWDVRGDGRDRDVAGAGIDLRLQEVDGPPAASCSFAVADVQATAARVRDAGGTAELVVAGGYGVHAECTDDQGQTFALHLAPPLTPRPTRSTVAYLTVEVPDSARYRAFCSAVLGWTFSPGSIADGWQVQDVAPMVGFAGGARRPAVQPMYRVDDIAAAVAAVRAHGGTATDPQAQPYGVSSECTDDQGSRFWLGQL